MMLKESLSVSPSKMARLGEVDQHGFDESKLGTRTDHILLGVDVSVVSNFSHLITKGLLFLFKVLEYILLSLLVANSDREAITIKAT